MVKKSDYTFLIIIGLLYFALIIQYLDIVEDTLYSLVHPDYNRKVLTLYDAIISQIDDYKVHNGRFLVHTITQYLCGSKYGHELFFILSTLSFVFLILGIIKIIRLYIINKNDKYLIILCIFFLTPVIGRVYLGHISHVVNYLWSSTLFVWFFYIFEILKKRKNVCINSCTIYFINFCIFFLGLIWGGWQESFTIPFAAYIIFEYIRNYKHITSYNKQVHILVLGFFVGLCLEVFAPSNFVRLENMESNISGIEKYKNAIKTIVHFQPLRYLILSILLYIIIKKKECVSFIKENIFYFIIISVNLLFAIFIALSGIHQLVVSSLCISILITKLCLIFLEKYNFYNKIVPYFSIIILLLYPYIYIYRQEIKQGWEIYKNCALDSKNNGYVNAKKLYQLHAELNSRNFFQKYTNIIFLNTHLVNDIYYKESTSLMLTNGKNKNLIQIVLPDSIQNIIKKCNKHNQLYEYIDGGCYILKIDENRSWENSIFLAKHKTTKYGLFKKKLLSKIGITKENKSFELIMPQFTYSFVKDKYRYIIINMAPSWFSEFKIKEIR